MPLHSARHAAAHRCSRACAAHHLHTLLPSAGFAEPIKATSKNLARKRPARSSVLLAAPPKHAQPVLPHSATGVRFCHAVPLVLQMLGPLVASTHVCMRSVLDEPTRPCPAVMNPGAVAIPPPREPLAKKPQTARGGIVAQGAVAATYTTTTSRLLRSGYDGLDCDIQLPPSNR